MSDLSGSDPADSGSPKPGRIPWLDGWRGLACWLMLVYHLLYDCMVFGWLPYETMNAWPLSLLERFIAFSFILCAGISAELSPHNVRHGLITSGAGLVVAAASYVIGAPIRFGVLQFLGLAMLIYAAAGRWLRRIPRRWAAVMWLLLFALTWIVTERVKVSVGWLFPLGLKQDGFVSFDYFPLMPYLFLFFAGAVVGGYIIENPGLPLLRKPAPGILTWPGRRTLWIYLLHQPVLFGGCFAVFTAIHLFF